MGEAGVPGYPATSIEPYTPTDDGDAHKEKGIRIKLGSVNYDQTRHTILCAPRTTRPIFPPNRASGHATRCHGAAAKAWQPNLSAAQRTTCAALSRTPTRPSPIVPL
eukprot:2942880-Prymnesium_polylepis.1